MRYKGPPIYSEAAINKKFLTKIKLWVKERDITVEAYLVSKSNLVLAVAKGLGGPRLICFYVQKLCALGNGGMVVYYDLDALSIRLKQNVENTFSNWIAQKSVA